MATRSFNISADRVGSTPEDFDQRLKYTGDVLLAGESLPGKSHLLRILSTGRKEGVENIPYTSGSAGASEAESMAQYLGVYALYQNVISPKPSDDAIKPLKQCLDDSIGLLDAVLDSYDEELERETNLNLLKEKIEDLWEQRDKYNRHFLDAVVQLKVVGRILDYEVLSKTQIESIKKVFSLLKKIELTREDRLLCWKTLEGSGIDLNAPIRGYEEFELVLKEKAHPK